MQGISWPALNQGGGRGGRGPEIGRIEVLMGFLGVPLVNGGSGDRVGYGGFSVKMGFSWKNRGFFGKCGFHGFLVNKSRKSRKEPGI